MITVVTSSDSRAWVHRAWIVYIAEPSASSASTGRSGQATAAPVASGRPTPIAPPVNCSQSCGAQPAVAAVMCTLLVLDSSHTIVPSRIVAATAAARLAPVSAPLGRAGGAAGSAGPSASVPDELGHGLQRAGGVVPSGGQHVHLAPVGHEVAGPARVGEERDRRDGVDQHEVTQPGQLLLGHLREVLDLLDGRDPGPALGAGDERLPEQPGPGAGGDAGRGEQRLPAQRRTAEQDRHRLARPQHLGDLFDRLGADGGPRSSGPSAPPGWRRRSTTRRRAGSAWPPDRAGRWRRGPPRPSPGTGPRCAPADRSSPRRCGPRCRCPTPAGRRSGRGTWRGRRRCSRRGSPPAGRCGGWRARCRGRARGAAACTPGRRSCGRSRRRHRWRRPRRGRARRASRAPRRARRRSASRSCPGS